MRWLVLVLALTCAAAFSQQAPQENKAKKATEDKKSGPTKQEVTVNLPPDIKVTVSGKLDSTAQHTYQKNESTGSEFWNFRLTDVLLAIFTGWLVYATVGLRNSTNKLWEASNAQFMAANRPRIRIKHVYITSKEIWG